MPFSSLGLSPALLAVLAEQNYKQPYPVQEAVIPPVLQGKDILGIAQTGSGKTAAFALPVLELLRIRPESKNRHIQVLVLVPTRELAVQTANVFQLFGSKLREGIKTLAVHGGVSINPQMMQLRSVDILVATPGRLLELIDSNAVHLSSTDILILDEADKMLNQGFKQEMDRLLGLLPAKRQNLLFSATLGIDVSEMAALLLHDPVRIEIKPEPQQLDLITQTAYAVSAERKGPLLRYLIKQKEMDQVLVFTSSVHKANSVVSKLRGNGIHADSMHSQKSQGGRTEALKQFKAGTLHVLVATDLASRGIDIPFLPYVINYELPRSPKDYIHRIGRTGRAEAPGNAISLVSPDEEHHFKVIQKKMGKQVPLIESHDFDLKGY
ncbi:MAG TPA: DEAD/DEAH box helicase [Bacteroidia bacterium]|jgi:ATP-dependent RNA helicase RhlE|nr:DEAD/DEAH box helicase [Bacteroidia bacterium]